ncbi:ATP-binding protein [candidate division MSBL1 archaeon SCGC-AAA261F17]|uniref:ATP-binding protein n=1 Tax=candidate division MSBL1 archaeon SCGC-AAA261F17 TaxID=1698274 RepID=A0A133V3L9_9EURY|nr:ATP-binding protein [candidate division MSBL1 archaeon SCGC-AAA261F17]
MDPRLEIIHERFANVERLISVASGKGGVGKSLISSTLALILSEKGYRVGLLDLDFHGPSAHTILGAPNVYPEEDKGVIPPEVRGIKLMSIVYYVGDNPSLLRGSDVSNSIIELLAITRWGSLDFLIIDMPPGIGDETLDTIRLLDRAEFLVVTTSSNLVWGTVKRLVKILKELKVPITGIVENKKITESPSAKDQANELGVPFLGEIGFDKELETTIGNADELLKTRFAQDTEKALGHLTRQK